MTTDTLPRPLPHPTLHPAPILMRLALGAVFVWFGVLKVLNVTPVGDLVADTLRWVPLDPALLVPALGLGEIVLGLLVIAGTWRRLVLTALALHLCGTFLVFALLPGVAFQDGNPLLLTTEGEFVLKNVVLIAGAVMLACWPRAARPPRAATSGTFVRT